MYLCWKCGTETDETQEACTYCGAKKKCEQVITNEQRIQQQNVRNKIRKERIAVMAILVILIIVVFKLIG